MIGNKKNFTTDNPAGYVDYHPGGSRILNMVTGRDGTQTFLDYHSVGYINQPSFAALKVGRLIEERARGDIRCDEIALHDYIFSLKGKLPGSPRLKKKAR